MFRFVRNIFSIERDSRFVARILFLSAPTALVFMVLVLLKLISPLLAIISLASVVVFNLLMLFPITFELQQIKKYVSNLAAGGDFDEKTMSLSEKMPARLSMPSTPCTVFGHTKPTLWKPRPFPTPPFSTACPTRL